MTPGPRTTKKNQEPVSKPFQEVDALAYPVHCQSLFRLPTGYACGWVLGYTLAVNRSRIGTEGNHVIGDLLKNRFRSSRSRKDQIILSDETQRRERFAPIIIQVTARVVFHVRPLLIESLTRYRFKPAMSALSTGKRSDAESQCLWLLIHAQGTFECNPDQLTACSHACFPKKVLERRFHRIL